MPRGFGARGKGFIDAGEVAPIQVLNSRLQKDVRVPGPRQIGLVRARSVEAGIERWPYAL
jgi:hypothetical protein